MSETLYKKVGRRYIPVSMRWDDCGIQIPVGSFVLVHSYQDGGRTYQYEVKPDNAGFRAAAMMARNAMVDAIRDASIASPPDSTTPIPYTKKQLALIEKFRQDMANAGALVPVWWHHKSAYEIADAGVRAVTE